MLLNRKSIAIDNTAAACGKAQMGAGNTTLGDTIEESLHILHLISFI